MSYYTNLDGNMCEREKEYILVQQKGHAIRYRSQTFLSAMFNDQGVARPQLQPVTHDMLADDNFVTAKMDHIVVASGAWAHVNFISDKWTEQVQISMFDHTIWSGARLPLNMQERWKWVLTHYDIEHTLWKYPITTF